MLGCLMLRLETHTPSLGQHWFGQPRFTGWTGGLHLLVGGAAESHSKGHGSGRGAEIGHFFVVSLLLISF